MLINILYAEKAIFDAQTIIFCYVEPACLRADGLFSCPRGGGVTKWHPESAGITVEIGGDSTKLS